MKSIIRLYRNIKNAKFFRGYRYVLPNFFRQNLRRDIFGMPTLFTTELMINSTCNYQCKHCSISRLPKKSQNGTVNMSLHDINIIASDMRNMHCLSCCLVGGEPFLRKDIVDVVNTFKRNNILTSIITNGSLCTEDNLRQLKASGLFNLSVSINGFSPAVHDSFSCCPGSFHQAMKAVGLAQKVGLRTAIAVVPVRENIMNGDFAAAMIWARDNNVRVNINYPSLAGEFTDKQDELLTTGEISYVERFFEWPNITSDFTILSGCPGGNQSVYITLDGEVCPCAFIHISYGNIFKESLEIIMRRLWSSYFGEKHSMCLTGQDYGFIKQYLDPVLKSKKLPMSYEDHPILKEEI